MNDNQVMPLNEAAEQLLDFLIRNKSEKIQAFMSFYDLGQKNLKDISSILEEIDDKIDHVHKLFKSLAFNHKVCITKCFDVINKDIEKF